MSGNKSIKEINKKLVIISLLCIAAIPFLGTLFSLFQNQDDMVYKFIITISEVLVSYSIGYIFIDIIKPELRDSLMSLNFKNPLPASRYLELCKKDHRITTDQIAYLSSLSGQNSYWYKNIYTLVKTIPMVHGSHIEYLKYREIFSGCICLTLLSIFLIIFSFFGASQYLISIMERTLLIESIAFLLCFYFLMTVLIGFIAKSKAERFVCNACLEYLKVKGI